jgi:hypothetical protein
MTRFNAILPFAVPGILACMMILGSAFVIIIADSIKESILITSVAVTGIATVCWTVGIIQTSKTKQWNILGYLMALISLFGVAVSGSIAVYWFVNLLPFM